MNEAIETNLVDSEGSFSWLQPVAVQSCGDHLQEPGSILGSALVTIQPPANVKLQCKFHIRSQTAAGSQDSISRFLMQPGKFQFKFNQI